MTLASRFHEFNRTNGTRCAPSPSHPRFAWNVRNPNTFFQLPRLPFSGCEAHPIIRFAHISSPAIVETGGKKNRSGGTLRPVSRESFHRNHCSHLFSASQFVSKSRKLAISKRDANRTSIRDKD